MHSVILRFCAVLAVSSSLALPAADNEAKQRAKGVRELGKGGSEAIPKLEPFLSDPDLDVRLEAVKAIDQIGTQRSLDPLVKATSDNDAEIQIRAIDGLVNFYVPGYLKSGLSGSIQRVGSAIKGKFTDTNDQVIDPYIQVRPEVVQALGRVAHGGVSMEARASAARALGILRGRAAVPDLVAALRSKDSQVIYESLIALQKIRDESAGPNIRFLLRDLDEKVQVTAIETEGLLQDHGAVNDLRNALDRTRSAKVKRTALTAMAQMPELQLRGLFQSYLDNKDEGLREAAAEGLGRLRDPGDQAAIQNAFGTETKSGPRLALAFALVQYGNRDMSDLAPLRYVVNELNSAGYRGVARAYLIELARDPATRQAMYGALQGPVVTKAEKTGLAQVWARSGERDSVPYLETLSKDSDPDVAQEGLRALRNLNARL
jgi:HEAT repeat protein